jgi:3-phosphoshikimate 1-carboxyvinyltransferase
MRLLAGLLAAQVFETELRGDESLSRRPMDRVVTPLRAMGAAASWPPLVVGGRTPVHGIDHEMTIASAQVKSALLLAGLFAEGRTSVVEPVPTRNHTELMLLAMGADLHVDGRRVEIRPAAHLSPLDIDVPGDLSAASFWLVASGLVAGSEILIRGVGTNSTRTVFLDVLRQCGFAIAVDGVRSSGGEPVGDLRAGAAPELRPAAVNGKLAAQLIDELPVLAVAATQLPGTSRIAGAAELRVKESDRIAAMAEGLGAMGADITAVEDGWVINGPRHLEGARVRSYRDHRVAMALAIAGLVADGTTEIEDAECVDISYPGFFDQLESLC